MAAFLPTFNLTIGYHDGNDDTHPIYATGPAQLYVQTKYGPDLLAHISSQSLPSTFIRTPKGGPDLIVGYAISIHGDRPGFYYVIRWWDRVHLGFPNQYREILVEQNDYLIWQPHNG